MYPSMKGYNGYISNASEKFMSVESSPRAEANAEGLLQAVKKLVVSAITSITGVKVSKVIRSDYCN